MEATVTKVNVENLITSVEAQQSLIAKAQNRETLAVMVHPWYTDNDSNNPNANSPEYRQRRDKFITACIQSGTPLVIFEEEHKLETIRERIKAEAGTIYVVPTEESDPTPSDPDFEDTFVNILTQANVGHLSIGGELLRIYHPIRDKVQRLKNIATQISEKRNRTAAASKWVNQDISLGGCVGSLADSLYHKGVDVTVSPITSPMQAY